jgi:hypothetical protein
MAVQTTRGRRPFMSLPRVHRRARSAIPPHSEVWSKLPSAVQNRVWSFAIPWPLVMSLSQVCRQWRTLVVRYQPNVPSARVAFELGVKQETMLECDRWMVRAKKRSYRRKEKEIARERASVIERAREREREKQTERLQKVSYELGRERERVLQLQNAAWEGTSD